MTTTLIKNAAWVIAWDERPGRQVYRRGVDLAFSRRPHRVSRARLSPGRRTVSSTARAAGDARPHRHPLAPRARAALSRRSARSTACQHAHDRALRALAGILGDPMTRRARPAPNSPIASLLLCGVTTLVDISAPWRRLDRAVRQKRACAAFSRPAMPRRAGISKTTMSFATPGTRRAAATGFAAALATDRRGAHPSLRPAVGCRLADADRYLHRRSACATASAAAQRARPSLHRAPRAERQRGARDDPPPRADPGAVGARHRACSVPARSSATRCSSTHHSWVRWLDQDRSRLARRQRDRGRALPDAVRPLWPDHGEFRRLSARRRGDGARHRLQPAQPRRGDAQGRRSWPASPRATSMSVTTADLFHAATAGGAKALLRDDLGRLAPGKKADLVLVDLDLPADAAGARPAALVYLSRRRPRGARRVCRRPSGRRRRQGADARPGRGRPAARRSAIPHAGGGAPARLSRAGGGRDRTAEPSSRGLSDHCAIRAVSDPIKPTFPVSLSDRPFAIASSRSLSWGRRSRTRRLPAMTAGNWSKSVTELRTLHCVGMTAIFCSSVILPWVGDSRLGAARGAVRPV